MKILCFGSLNIDYVYKVDHFVQKGETLSSDSLQVFSGGKGLNQSVALARSGVEAYHAGSIGEDGKFLLSELQEAGVNTDYVNVLKTVRTGNAIIQNNKDGDNCILLYGGANQAITTDQVDAVLEHFQCGDFVVLQNEINEVPYIMEQAYNRKMKIALNPSPMDEKIKKMPLEYVDYFLLNKIEAGQILETEGLDGEAMANALHEKFPKAAGIAITRMGAAPSIPDIREVIDYIYIRKNTFEHAGRTAGGMGFGRKSAVNERTSRTISESPFSLISFTCHTLPAVLPNVCPLLAETLRSALRFRA